MNMHTNLESAASFVVRNSNETSTPSPSPSEVIVAVPAILYLRIDSFDAPTEAEGIALGREAFEKLPLNAALKDVPLMATIIKDPAFVIPPALLDGAIPLYLSVLAFLEPVSDLILRCA